MRSSLIFTLFVFVSFFIPVKSLAQHKEAGLKIGDDMPSFKATDDYGDTWDSDKAKGREILVIYFYPAAMTEGCTKQASSYRDDMDYLEGYDVEVVGISGDYPEGLRIFRKANNLNYTLLSDPEGKVAKLFGVPVKKGGETEHEINGKKVKLKRGVTLERQTFIVDKNGKIIYINRDVKPAEDSQEVLKVIEKIVD
ncbi:MAG: peroxiredoxin [Chlorobi bacterium]|nr:peroxiredoxin [Chlorobiota bacterium]